MRPDSRGPAAFGSIVDRLRAGHPEREGGDDEGEPAEGRGFPVVGAPASHPRSEIVVRGA
jgi:hypothetical protein